MDRFTEQVITKKNRTLDEIMYFLSWPVMIILALFAFLNLQLIFRQFDVVTLVMTLIAGGGAAVMFLFHDRLRTEYEYTFTNGDLDFAQVYNNRKRKSLGSLKVKNVEAFGKVSGQNFQRYLSMKDTEQLRWFLNRDAELYYFFFQKEGKRRILIFEPNEEIVEYVKQYLPMGAWQKDN